MGLARLRLHPDSFWRLTPRELMLMAGQDGGAGDGAAMLDRAGLDALIARFGPSAADRPSKSKGGDQHHDRR